MILNREDDSIDIVTRFRLTLAEIHVVNRGAWMRPDLRERRASVYGGR